MINFDAIKLEHNDVLVFEQNISAFPTDAIRKDQFPISFPVYDFHGSEFILKIDRNFNLTFDKVFEYDLSIKELYYVLYGMLEEGQRAGYNFESDYFGSSSYNRVELEQTTAQVESLSKQFPFNFEPTNVKIQSLPHLNTLRYYGLSKTGHIVAIKDYNIRTLGLKWQHRGVFRLPLQTIRDSNTVLIVENPLIADFLQTNSLCAISLPSEDEVTYYDYPALLSGKEILFCTRSYGQNFSFSIYPLATSLIGQNLQVSKVNLYNAFSNTSISSWLKTNNPQQLIEVLRKNATPIHASEVPARGIYDGNRTGSGIIEFNPAQDVKKGSLLYSYEDKMTILSNPIRKFKYYELKKMEKLQPSHHKPVQSRLDQDMIDHVKQGDYLQPSSLYPFIRSFIKRYLYFEHPQVFDILTAWVIGTYVYRFFQAFPYLHFMGQRGTGKTTILEILSQLCFNGKHLTKATPASLIHQVHYHGSTLCIDEFEDYSSKRKSEDDLSRFLNGGYHYRGSYEKRSKGSNAVLNTYSPKAFGGTGNIFIDTLRSRSIQIKTLEKPTDIPKDQFVEFDSHVTDDIRLIQLSCFAFGLTNTSKLFNTLTSIPTDIRLPISNIKLDNRKLQLTKPLLTITQLTGEKIAKKELLKGLDICWYEDAAKQSKIVEAMETILKDFLENNQPDNEDEAYLHYITKKLFNSAVKKKFAKEHKPLRKKGNFNHLLEKHFDITRDTGYATTTQKNASLYYIPKNLVNNI